MSEARCAIFSSRIAAPSLTSAYTSRSMISRSSICRGAKPAAFRLPPPTPPAARPWRPPRRMCGGVAGLVVIPAGPGFLAEAAELAQPVGDLGVTDLGMLGASAFADVPADVVAGQVAHPERTH